MSKIVELKLAETKAIVGGASAAATSLAVKIPTGTVSVPSTPVVVSSQHAPKLI